jgi:hypothetical protein
MNEIQNKKSLGQFFTTHNPFNIDIFYKWMNLIPDDKKEFLIEPFAGANNIVKMIQDLGFKNSWKCFDINPSENNVVPEYKIIKEDTILNFPKGYYVGITNPPYLAKNSATRSNMEFPDTLYDDLYKLSLDSMLNNLEYIAAIIPESFINSNLFHNRIFAFVSLTNKMFEDTECPVCLALFVPTNQKNDLNLSENDFFIYRQNKKIGKYEELKKKKPSPNITNEWSFNDKAGIIGIKCIDGTINPSIEFIKGDEIDSNKIKVSSRSITRVSGLPKDIDLDIFLKKCNEKLIKYREDTEDIFLTSFKGLRKDNKYRRRLDFSNARVIMNCVLEKIKQIKED